MGKIDFLLLVVSNLFWAANPTAAKFLVERSDPATTAWLKYLGAGLGFLAFLPWAGKFFKEENPGPASPHDLAWMAGIGATTCFLSPLCQMSGLGASSAVTNSLLVSTEPLFTLVLAWALLRETASPRDVAALAVGAAGSLAVSGFFTPGTLADVPSALRLWSRGDMLLLASIFCEGCYSVFPKRMRAQVSGIRIYGTALATGFVLLSAVVFLKGGPRLHGLRGAWPALLWLGPLGTGATYLIWIRILQKGIPLPAMILTLFLQPVFGALAAAVVLHEPLRAHQILGGLLILAAVGHRLAGEKR
jgi:drug/metabolite transporter (DMT)-like permease